jgi:hypothetical protein
MIAEGMPDLADCVTYGVVASTALAPDLAENFIVSDQRAGLLCKAQQDFDRFRGQMGKVVRAAHGSRDWLDTQVIEKKSVQELVFHAGNPVFPVRQA